MEVERKNSITEKKHIIAFINGIDHDSVEMSYIHESPSKGNYFMQFYILYRLHY